MASHSSILAWRIPWTEETGRLQSMGSQRVRTEQLQLVHIICSPDGASDKEPARQCRRYKRYLIQSLGWENHLEE